MDIVMQYVTITISLNGENRSGVVVVTYIWR